MSDSHEARCPQCRATLDPGFVGFFSGIMWSDGEPTGWRRLIPFVFGSARFIIGNLTSPPWIRCRAAHRCSHCGTLVIPTTRH